MSTWIELEDELDRWAAESLEATFWWRDDDATETGPALSATLATARDAAAPLALAVVPATATGALALEVADRDGVWILQHGYAHRNHEPKSARKSEYGASRSPTDAIAELKAGWLRLRSLFGAKALPVLVPPWNRIDPRIAARLSCAGYAGLSAFRGHDRDRAGAPLRRVHTHVDLIDWRGDRRFRGEDDALDATLARLRERRSGNAPGNEPTGLLTHHLIGDSRCLDFVARLAALIASHRAAKWVSPQRLFID